MHFSPHLVAKQAMDKVDLISRLTWFGGYPEVKVADSCIQLLFKRQILWAKTYCIVTGCENTLKLNYLKFTDLKKKKKKNILYCLDLEQILNQYLSHGPLHHDFFGKHTEHCGQVLHKPLLVGSHRGMHIHPVGERIMRAWKTWSALGSNVALTVRGIPAKYLSRVKVHGAKHPDLPGTARCLRGMALSLEESEPIQSALAMPMPAGRVFIPESTSQ